MQAEQEKTFRSLPDKLGYGRVAEQAHISYQTVSKYAKGMKMQRHTQQAIIDALCTMISHEAEFWGKLRTHPHTQVWGIPLSSLPAHKLTNQASAILYSRPDRQPARRTNTYVVK